jgi:hypothetical protein
MDGCDIQYLWGHKWGHLNKSHFNKSSDSNLIGEKYGSHQSHFPLSYQAPAHFAPFRIVTLGTGNRISEFTPRFTVDIDPATIAASDAFVAA